ncbi:Retrovirus-related Pol polyprotein from transposon [Ceratobasidium sp. AG-Ba]|nr:Retrovirus-related Pol polyprotein from transposon [Ceratobasidium sp. AG-Ba]
MASNQPTRLYSRSGLQRTTSQASIRFDIQGPLQPNRTNVLGPEPPTPERSYQRKFTLSPAHTSTSLSSLQRYLPYPWQKEHYQLDATLKDRYMLPLPMAQRISNLQHLADNAINEERRNARQIGRMIYQRPTPPEEHMFYLSQQDERLVQEEMNILDYLTRFELQYVVVDNNRGIPVQSHNDEPQYWKLYNLLANRRQDASIEVKRRGPAVPEWPHLQDSFDSKQFIVAAVLYRDEVTRFLAYYLKEELSHSSMHSQSISFDGFSLSRVLAEDRKPKFQPVIPPVRKGSYSGFRDEIVPLSRPESALSAQTNPSPDTPKLPVPTSTPNPLVNPRLRPGNPVQFHLSPTESSRHSDPDHTVTMPIRIPGSESDLETVPLSPPHSMRSEAPIAPTPPPLPSFSRNSPLPAPQGIALTPFNQLFNAPQPDASTSIHVPGGFPKSPPKLAERHVVEVQDHTMIRQSLEDEPLPGTRDDPYILSLPPSRIQTPSQRSSGSVLRIAQTPAEAAEAARQTLVNQQTLEYSTPTSLEGLSPRLQHVNPSNLEHSIYRTQMIRRDRTQNLPEPTPVPSRSLSPVPQSSSDSSRRSNPTSQTHSSQFIQEPWTDREGRMQPPVIETSGSSEQDSPRICPMISYHPDYSPPSQFPPATIEEVEDEEAEVSSHAVRTHTDEERLRRAEARRIQRDLDQARRRRERQEDEEARLARLSSRIQEEPITRDISMAANINPTRGRYSHNPNPTMDSLADPPSMQPIHESTPFAPRTEPGPSRQTRNTRPSLAVPEYIGRMGNTGLADLVGNDPPHSRGPRFAPPNTSRSHGPVPSFMNRDPPPHRSSTRSSSHQAGGGSGGNGGGRGGPPSDDNSSSDNDDEQDPEEPDEDEEEQRYRHRNCRGRFPPAGPPPGGPPPNPPNPPNNNNDQDQARDPQNWRGPLPFHVEQKLKISDLPEFDGSDTNLIDWLTKVNNLAEQSNIIATQLGSLLPYRFKERASNWWFSIPRDTRDYITIDWYSLRAAISSHFMNATWMAKQRSYANKMRFRHGGNSDELPIDYVLRKKKNLMLIQTMSFNQLIHEIIIGAPAGWQTILRIDDLQGEWTEFVNRVHTHSQALIESKSTSNIHHRLERLEQDRNRKKVNSHFSGTKSGNKFFKKDKGKLKSPNFKSFQKRLPKVKKPPSEVNARPCIHCSGDHWDYECPKSRKNQGFVRSNLAATDQDGLAAQEEYDNLYEALSSEDSSDTESEPSAQEEQSETSDEEEDFNSPSDVQSATASSEQPVADNEESQDVSEGNTIGQTTSGFASARCNLASAPDLVNKLPTRRSLRKQYKLQHIKTFQFLGYTPIGKRLVLRRVMSRPPGTAWMGTKSSIVKGRIGDLCPDFEITFDSGSDITLISQKKWESLKPVPPKRKGSKIKIIQVTNNCFINEFITVPLVFNTKEGPVEMLVEAYVVKDMSTDFILGNDFGNQYLLSLLRNKEGTFVELGTSGRLVPVLRTDTDPRTDSAGHVFQVQCCRTTAVSRLKTKKDRRTKIRSQKALASRPSGSVPVRIYEAKTLAPRTLNLVRVKTTFDPGEECGFVEKAFNTDKTGSDLYGITHCIIHANNPKLQIANFGDKPIKLHSGQIIGYMFPVNTLVKDGELSVQQKKECEATAQFIQSLEKLEQPPKEDLDMNYAVPAEGGPKIWDNPGPDHVKKEQLLQEVNFGPTLTPEQKSALEKVILKHFDAFGLDGRLGEHPVPVAIRLKDEDAPPISIPPYSLSPAKTEAVVKQVKEWYCLGVIAPTKSPWAFPLIVVYRSNKPRVCVDYRKINERIIVPQYPLPSQRKILNTTSGSKFLSCLDALSGFTQMRIREEDQDKTAFTCPIGHYKFIKFPFGLAHGPAEFQQRMDGTLAEYNWDFLCVYIDDIIIFSKSFEEHLAHIGLVLAAITKSGFTLSPKKCNFGFVSLLLLGHKVSRLGMSSHQEKVDAIINMAEPKNKKELMTLNGLIVYYAWMIPRMAEIMAPLFDLLKKETPWEWGPLQKEAFRLIKLALTSAPVLAFPEQDKPFRLYTDASNIGLSGVLQQIQIIEVKDLKETQAFNKLEKAYKEGKPVPKMCTPVPKEEHVMAGGNSTWNSENWLETKIPIERVCAYWSRVLRPAERNYSATEREALALKEALTKFQAHLEGAQFTAFTDHNALLFANKFAATTTRLAKFSLFFTTYPGMTIMHRAGRVHDNADPLSRYLWRIPHSTNPLPDNYKPLQLKEEEDALKNTFAEYGDSYAKDIDTLVSHYVTTHLDEFEPSTEVFRVHIGSEEQYSQDYDTATTYHLVASIVDSEISRIREEYSKDPHYSKVLPWLSPESPTNKTHYPQYAMKDNGLIYYIGGKEGHRLCIPKTLVPEVIQEAHELATEGAHAGYARTYNRLCATYYWPNMADSVEVFTKTCDVCQKTKPRRHGKQGYLQPIPIPEQPFEVITVDFIMDLPESSGYNAILVIVDKLTRYAHFIPCHTHINEIDSAKLFRDHIWSHYGLPRQIISDRDARWTGAFWDHLTSLLGIKRALTTAHHPQADGQTEVMNQNLEIMLRSYIDQVKSNWSELLPALAFSYNTSTHSVTRQTPAFLLRGYEPLRPAHLLTNTSQHIPRIESNTAEDFSEEMEAARNKAKEAIRIGQIYQERAYNKGRYFAHYQPGDQVLINLKTLNLLKGKGTKLDQIYDGPFEVMEQISPVTYRLRLPESYSMHPVINIAHLEKYSTSSENIERSTLPPKRELDQDDNIYEVERIVDEGWERKGRRRVKLYKIRWTNYDADEDSWITANRLRNAPDVLRAWNKAKASMNRFPKSH